jgi:hypothetical protein
MSSDPSVSILDILHRCATLLERAEVLIADFETRADARAANAEAATRKLARLLARESDCSRCPQARYCDRFESDQQCADMLIAWARE